jgi:peptide/nickel transport system substrate-binding protein
MVYKTLRLLGGWGVIGLLLGCYSIEELSEEEINRQYQGGGVNSILGKTVSKPWRGEGFIPGKVAGSWHGSVQADPKSFNILVAEQDSATSAVANSMLDYLVDYDPAARQWKPRAADFEIQTHEDRGTLDVIYTLRDDLYWSYYGSDKKSKVSSDDVIFWYNEIEGDPACNSSAYTGQFLTLEDGGEGRVTIEKIDNRRFVFHFPRIVADPLLSTNRTIAPRIGYEQAKQERGGAGAREIYGIHTDPKTIPSMGKWFLTEYTPGQRLVFKRNPDYWDKNARGISIPYLEEEIAQIIPEENTRFLLFKEGKVESYGPRPEDLSELLNNPKADYTVFNAEGALSASFWTFNQNPKNQQTPQYAWFTQTPFRQAMSCLLNRDRIINQVYRGLAEPKLTFFPEPNAFFNPAIQMEYRYDPPRALEMLESIGFTRDDKGVMRDGQGRAVEFSLAIRSDSAINADIASIITDELKKAGIRVRVRTVDFNKLVEQLFATFEWESVIMGLSGANIFPTQGSNVWPSSGNLHLWHPLQEKPATPWEARIDYLYNEGAYTIDQTKAKAYWDEYQRIILDQCPVIYLARPRSFYALRNRWDPRNVYFDNINGFEMNYLFLKS